MNRRGFIAGLIGAVAAPAIVRPESLMKLWVPRLDDGFLVRPFLTDEYQWRLISTGFVVIQTEYHHGSLYQTLLDAMPEVIDG